MYNRYQLAAKYIQYYLTASNGKGHGIHPPFIYDFITRVLNDNSINPAYNSIEQLRNKLLHDNQLIHITDFGAGSRTNNSKQKSIKSIAQTALKPTKYSQLLYRIVQYYSCRNIIELGTSLGLTTAYLASANNFAVVHTCEGSSNIATVAKNNFQQLFLNNISLYEGEFNESYTSALNNVNTIDLLYIDGNHQYEPTLQYFEKALPKLNSTSIVIFDDIHWSEPMERAWQKIKEHPLISETIDLFFIGIAFFRTEQQAKQNFTIRF